MDHVAKIIKVEKQIQQLRNLADKMESELYKFSVMSLQPGATKSIGGKNYVWKVGKSGKARWHRTNKGDGIEGHRVTKVKGYQSNPAFNSPWRFEGSADRYYPEKTKPGTRLTEPVYGRGDKHELELEGKGDSKPYAYSYEEASRRAQKNAALARVAARPYIQSMLADTDGDGVDEAARVGIPGKAVQPPPPLRRVRGLDGKQQIAEAEFITAWETEKEFLTTEALKIAESEGRAKGSAPVFETDGMKVLAGASWQGAENRAKNNVALHQAANAVCKTAFKQYLAKIPKGSNILVTCGGCGAGKGHILKNNPLAKQMMDSSQAIWDSAGDQNSTENPWILAEAEKYGHKVTYLYVHSDPLESWAHPERGVVQRAMDPKNGRMVTARVFADSYALGAKNFSAFAKKQSANPNVKFKYFKNGANPSMIPDIPPEAFHDSDKLYDYALGVIDQRHDLPSHIREAATFKFGA